MDFASKPTGGLAGGRGVTGQMDLFLPGIHPCTGCLSPRAGRGGFGHQLPVTDTRVCVLHPLGRAQVGPILKLGLRRRPGPHSPRVGDRSPKGAAHAPHPAAVEGSDAPAPPPTSSGPHPAPASPAPRLLSMGMDAPLTIIWVSCCLPRPSRLRSACSDVHQFRSAPGTIFALGKSQTFIL